MFVATNIKKYLANPYKTYEILFKTRYRTIMSKDDLETFLKNNLFRKSIFSDSIIVEASTLQENFASFLYNKFTNYNWVKYTIDLYRLDETKQLLSIALNKASGLYGSYKKYLTDLIITIIIPGLNFRLIAILERC